MIINKIDLVITAGNLNHHYLQLFPFIKLVWNKRFNLPIKLIFIGTKDELPEYLNKYLNDIIFFNHIPHIHDIFIAQVIRILYPALFPDKNVLITDLDIIPSKISYFTSPLNIYSNQHFITWTDRYIHQKMYAICYNLAKGSTFQNIFKINDENDIIERIKEWYNDEYTGKKNCPGWYTDQKKLYEYLNQYDRLIVLRDNDIGFNRLGNRGRDKKYITENFNEILNTIDNYSDIHCIKPFKKTKNYIKKLCSKLIQI